MKTSACLLLLGMSLPVLADTPQQILERLQVEAGAAASPERGKQLYLGKFGGGKTDSCSTCHTTNPRDAGRHARTNKVIEALAPAPTGNASAIPRKWKNGSNATAMKSSTAPALRERSRTSSPTS